MSAFEYFTFSNHLHIQVLKIDLINGIYVYSTAGGR